MKPTPKPRAKRTPYEPLQFFKGDYNQERHYWRLRAKNGRIVADSAEGYESLAMAKKGFRAAAKLAAKALAQMDKL